MASSTPQPVRRAYPDAACARRIAAPAPLGLQVRIVYYRLSVGRCVITTCPPRLGSVLFRRSALGSSRSKGHFVDARCAQAYAWSPRPWAPGYPLPCSKDQRPMRRCLMFTGCPAGDRRSAKVPRVCKCDSNPPRGGPTLSAHSLAIWRPEHASIRPSRGEPPCLLCVHGPGSQAARPKAATANPQATTAMMTARPCRRTRLIHPVVSAPTRAPAPGAA